MKYYKNVITLNKNERGIWDLDVSKGCASGLKSSDKGCYDECYAAKSAKIRGYDFKTTIFRDFKNVKHERQIIKKINKIDMPFIRIGCSGDPSENWEHTFSILRKLKNINKEIVIITKHWNKIPDNLLNELKQFKICINTSVSALDEEIQLESNLAEYNRLKKYCKSILRIVSCDFNISNEIGKKLHDLQNKLFENDLVIDTVLRVSKDNELAKKGIINIKKIKFLNSYSLASKYNKKTFFGKCQNCIEKCGIFNESIRRVPIYKQQTIF